ncbi:MAG: hypothetical protein Q7R47_00640, partial [Candidatus Diapherotrites archaeon]|nr:hypothetical protein [Candidatus Diapherotrites archaeon]
LLGIVFFPKDQQRAKALLLGWLLIGLGLGLAPQGKKFLIGAAIPFAILASFGVIWVWENLLKNRLRSKAAKAAAVLVLAILVFPTHIVNTQDKIAQVQTDPNAFMSADELDAMRFLEKQPYGTVLSDYRIGNNVIWMTPHKAILGHWGETLRLAEKTRLVESFFSDQTPVQLKASYLREQQVRYIFYGSDEKKLGSLDPALPLQRIFGNATTDVYRVE